MIYFGIIIYLVIAFICGKIYYAYLLKLNSKYKENYPGFCFILCMCWPLSLPLFLRKFI